MGVLHLDVGLIALEGALQLLVLMLIPVVVVASLPSELGVLVPLGRVLD